MQLALSGKISLSNHSFLRTRTLFQGILRFLGCFRSLRIRAELSTSLIKLYQRKRHLSKSAALATVHSALYFTSSIKHTRKQITSEKKSLLYHQTRTAQTSELFPCNKLECFVHFKQQNVRIKVGGVTNSKNHCNHVNFLSVFSGKSISSDQ